MAAEDTTTDKVARTDKDTTTDKVATIGTVVVNVVDLEVEKAFWQAVLGVGVAREFEGFFCWLEPQHPGGVQLALQKTDTLKESRNRVHIDTGVADLDEAQRRIEDLGGSMVEEHSAVGFTWRIMADPEGNEFCIAPAGG